MKNFWMSVAVLCIFHVMAAAQSPFEKFYEKWSDADEYVTSVYVSHEMLDFIGEIGFSDDEDLDAALMIKGLDHIIIMSVEEVPMLNIGMKTDLEKITDNLGDEYKELVRVNDGDDKMTIYYNENGAESEIVLISLSGSGNYREANIILFAGDITKEDIKSIVSAASGE